MATRHVFQRITADFTCNRYGRACNSRATGRAQPPIIRQTGAFHACHNQARLECTKSIPSPWTFPIRTCVYREWRARRQRQIANRIIRRRGRGAEDSRHQDTARRTLDRTQRCRSGSGLPRLPCCAHGFRRDLRCHRGRQRPQYDMTPRLDAGPAPSCIRPRFGTEHRRDQICQQRALRSSPGRVSLG